MYSIEQWGMTVLNFEFDITGVVAKDYYYDLIETPTEYLLKYGENASYSVNKKEYQSVIKYLNIKGFNLFCWTLDGGSYRFSYEKKDAEEKTLLTFHLGEYCDETILYTCQVVAGDKKYDFFTFLAENTVYAEAVFKIREKFIDWLQDSKENRLSYLLNVGKWHILDQLEEKILAAPSHLKK
jgi:hypothetical protein